jgi:hypothetical protein
MSLGLERKKTQLLYLMFHGGLCACVDARVEDFRFEDSNPRMCTQIWRIVLELSRHVHV